MGADHGAGLANGAFAQIAAAIPACFRSGRVARATVRAVDVRTCLGLFDKRLIPDQFLPLDLLELNVFRLRSATVLAHARSARIAAAAIRAGPLKLYVT
jgi:hypothetical protein